MNKTQTTRFIAIMEFFYGFLFGVAVFSAAITFLIAPDFLSGVLFAVSVFAFFIFLCMLTRYCIIKTKISLEILETQLESKSTYNKLIHVLSEKRAENDEVSV